MFRSFKIAVVFCVVCLGGVGGANAAPVQWLESTGGNDHWYEAVCAEQPVAVDGWHVVEGQTLVAYTGGITWTAAQDAATAKGGWLVDITSAAENAFAFSLVEPGNHPQFWYPELGYGIGLGPFIGGFQPAGSLEPGGNWQWVTGSAFTDANGSPIGYTNWFSGYQQPQNHYQIADIGPPEDALHFYGSSPGWNDFPSWEVTNGYIVEYVPEPSSLALLIAGGGALLAWAWRRRRA